MSVKKITFVIVNYNTSELLLKCVNNLLDIWPNKQIIVVDNGSTDDSCEAIKAIVDSHEEVALIKTTNKGISAANNLAIKQSDGDYICHLGTDAFPTPKSIHEMFGFMELSNETGILTPRLVLRNGSIDRDAHRGFPTPWTALTHFLYLDRLFPKSKLFNQYFMGWEDFTTTHPIQACISHFMFVRKEVYTSGLSWDTDYFIFGEDIDFCYRVQEAGFKVIYLGSTEVLHYKGAGVGRKTSRDVNNASNSSKETKVKVAKASTEAMRLFYKKHLANKYPPYITLPILKMVDLMEKFRVRKVESEFRNR